MKGDFFFSGIVIPAGRERLISVGSVPSREVLGMKDRRGGLLVAVDFSVLPSKLPDAVAVEEVVDEGEEKMLLGSFPCKLEEEGSLTCEAGVLELESGPFDRSSDLVAAE